MRLPSLAQWGLVIVVASLMLARNQTAMAQGGGVRNVSFDGISFAYDASLTGGVTSKLVPENIVTDGGFWLAQPQHIEFNFTDFHGSSTQSLSANIYVVPVRSDYTSLTPTENHDLWLPSIQQLQELLSKHPDLRTALEQSSASPHQPVWLPYLPPINAATIATGKVAYLKFRNGVGIRYLVHTTQDVSPPDRDDTAYTFQGLTGDGKYYVAAFFSAFPTAMQPIELFQGDDIRAYYLDLNDRFDRISNDIYTPNLDSLDKMIGSLSVHPQGLGGLPGLPGTGGGVETTQYAGMLILAAFLLLGGGLILARRAR
jgi:hypothetical protein